MVRWEETDIEDKTDCRHDHHDQESCPKKSSLAGLVTNKCSVSGTGLVLVSGTGLGHWITGASPNVTTGLMVASHYRGPLCSLLHFTLVGKSEIKIAFIGIQVCNPKSSENLGVKVWWNTNDHWEVFWTVGPYIPSQQKTRAVMAWRQKKGKWGEGGRQGGRRAPFSKASWYCSLRKPKKK